MKVKIIESCYADNSDEALGPVGNGARLPGDIVDTKRSSLLIGIKKAIPYTDDDVEDEVDDVPETDSDDDDFPTLSDDDGDEPTGANASDAVKQFAIENGVDLMQVEGTGKGGTILKRDVQAVIAARSGSDESLTKR